MLSTFDALEHFLEFDLHDTDCVSALRDSLFKLLLLVNVVWIVLIFVQISQLVAKLFFSHHDRLELDEDSRRHVEEIVFGIKLLVFISKASAPVTKFVNSLLHLASLVLF